MALSIKNQHAEELATRLASVTGETMTHAVIVALEERLERITGRRSGPDLVASILEISRRCATLPDMDTRPADEILGYDDRGTFDGAR
jgi:antitoxin VapB